MVEVLLLILAMVCFLIAAFIFLSPRPPRVNFVALGLFFLVWYFLYPALLNVPVHHSHLLR